MIEPGAPFHIHFSDIQFANRNETKHLPYGEGRCAPSRCARRSRGSTRPATVISESPDRRVDRCDQGDPRRVGRAGSLPPCSTRTSSRRTTSAGCTRRSSTRRARTRSAARTSSSSRRRRSRSGATCACRRRRWPPRCARVRRTAAPRCSTSGWSAPRWSISRSASSALDGGIAVTASHNPKEYTGMKIVRRGALPVGGESGLLDVRDRALAARVARDGCAGTVRPGGHLGAVRRPRALVRRRRRAAAASDRHRRGERDGGRNAAAGARAAADAGRRHAATSSRTARSRTTSRTRCCRRTASSSSARRRARAPISASPTTVTPTAASSSTTRGEFVPGDFTTALFAQSILAREPGGKVIYDVRASWAVPEAISEAGGVPLMNRVGHAFIKQRMREEDAVFARRGVGALLLPRLLAGRFGDGAVPADVRARVAARQAERGARAVPRRGTSSPARSTRRWPTSPAKLRELEERFGADGTGHAPRRAVGRLRRLALQRAPVEHGAAAAAEPRSALAGADGREARRGARGHPRVRERAGARDGAWHLRGRPTPSRDEATGTPSRARRGARPEAAQHAVDVETRRRGDDDPWSPGDCPTATAGCRHRSCSHRVEEDVPDRLEEVVSSSIRCDLKRAPNR